MALDGSETTRKCSENTGKASEQHKERRCGHTRKGDGIHTRKGGGTHKERRWNTHKERQWTTQGKAVLTQGKLVNTQRKAV